MGRYDRQIPVFGLEGQKRLADATVGIVGLGGLGCSAVTALASAGVGHLVLVDGDSPSESNLNRQFIYRDMSAGTKADQAAEWARSLNPDADVSPFGMFLTDSNAPFILDGCDLLVDCLDTVEARMCLNRYAVGAGKVLVHAGVEGLTGQVTVVRPGMTPCLRCLMGERRDIGDKPSLGAAVAALGSMEAVEAVKVLTGCGTPLCGSLLSVDLASDRFEVVDVGRDPGCPVCGHLRVRTWQSKY